MSIIQHRKITGARQKKKGSWVSTQLQVTISIYCVCMSVCVCVCVCMHVCMYVCFYVYICVYVCVYVCVHVCEHIYVFSGKDPRTPSPGMLSWFFWVVGFPGFLVKCMVGCEPKWHMMLCMSVWVYVCVCACVSPCICGFREGSRDPQPRNAELVFLGGRFSRFFGQMHGWMWTKMTYDAHIVHIFPSYMQKRRKKEERERKKGYMGYSGLYLWVSRQPYWMQPMHTASHTIF